MLIILKVWSGHKGVTALCLSLNVTPWSMSYKIKYDVVEAHATTRNFLWGIWAIHVAKRKLIVGRFDCEGLHQLQNYRHTGGKLPTCFGSSIHYTRLAYCSILRTHMETRNTSILYRCLLAQTCLLNKGIVQNKHNSVLWNAGRASDSVHSWWLHL